MSDGIQESSEFKLLEAYREQGYEMDRKETPDDSLIYSLTKDGGKIITMQIDRDRDLRIVFGSDVTTERFVALTNEYFGRVNEKAPDYPFDGTIETGDMLSLTSPDSNTLFMLWPSERNGGKPSKIEVSVPSRRLDKESQDTSIHLLGFVQGVNSDIPRDMTRILINHALQARTPAPTPSSTR